MNEKQRSFKEKLSQGICSYEAYKQLYSTKNLSEKQIRAKGEKLADKLLDKSEEIPTGQTLVDNTVKEKDKELVESIPTPYLESYSRYCSFVHGDFWKDTKVSLYLCKQVEDFITRDTGNPYDILIVSMPPQHGKSMTITETLPSWYLCKYPHGRVIEISYNEELATLFGRRNLQKLVEHGGELGLELAKNPKGNKEFELKNGVGGMISRGVMSGITGRACNLMIIDDPIKNRSEADSGRYRQRLYDEWENSFKTRLSARAKVIIIQTRWHEDDLAGRIIASEQNVQVINLPCEAEESDPMGRSLGEPLAPEIGKDNNWLKQFKESYQYNNGTRAWNALFQGRPSSSQGNIFLRQWWNYYEILPSVTYRLVSVDAAFKSGVGSDYVAIQLWGVLQGDFYLIDAIRARLDFPQTISAIHSIMEGHTINLILIEDTANGPAIIQMLKKEFSFVLGVSPLGGKEARANAIAGVVESGRVHLPKFAAFTGEFVEECSNFPYGKHDDQVDAMTQALNRMVYHMGKGTKGKTSTSDKLSHSFKLEDRGRNILGNGGKDNVI